MTTNSLRAGTLSFGEERLEFSHKEVGTQSIGSGLDSGIMPHQTAIQEHFLLDIIGSDSLDVFNGIANTTATNQSGNWYRWGTFLKHTGIANKFLGGVGNV